MSIPTKPRKPHIIALDDFADFRPQFLVASANGIRLTFWANPCTNKCWYRVFQQNFNFSDHETLGDAIGKYNELQEGAGE